MTTDVTTAVADRLFIGGKWTEATDGRFAVLDPSTSEEIASVGRAGLADVESAIDAAADASFAWAASVPRDRAAVLRGTAELMRGERERLARLLCAEMGKPIGEARTEIDYAADYFSWFADEAPRRGGELRLAPHGGGRILTQHRPVGISLLITPWNFPAAMPARKLAPALAAGCTVVLKPAEDTPLTALALVELMIDAGLPPGVVNVVTTDRPQALVEHALADRRVTKLSFTGSTAVGSALLAQASRRVVNCSMELGGNAPFIVLEGADLDQAVAGAVVAKMRNGGQACTAANRFLIQRSIADEFTERLADALARMTVGSAHDEKTDVGPLINRRACDRVDRLVADTVALGARVVLGGAPAATDSGSFYAPTVLSGVDRGSRVAREEIFGPVAPIIAVDDVADAVRLANDTDLGLAAYVYAESLEAGLALSEGLEAGMVAVDRGYLSDPAAPFGGVKQSGLGREGGLEGIAAYEEVVYVSANW